MKFIFSFTALLCGLWMQAQQTFTVRGKILDYHDKIPLKEARISLAGKQTQSDNSGSFTFKKIPVGAHNLQATHPSCEPYLETLNVHADLEITIQMEHHVEEIETITLHIPHKNANSLIVKTLDRQEIERNTTENLGNALSSLSGVGALKTGNQISKPIIHGLYGSRVPIISNGVKLAEQEWGVEHAPNVDINHYDHLDVIKGASALKYGSDAVGGVVVLEPSVFKKRDTLQGNAKFSGISNGRGGALALDVLKTWENGWAVKTAGGYRKTGDLKTPDYYLMNTGAEQQSLAFTVQNNSFLQGISFDYTLTAQEIGIYRGSDLGNLEDFYKALTSDIPLYTGDFSYKIQNPKQEVQHHIAKISAFRRLEKLGKVSLDYSFQYNHRKEYDIRRGELAQLPSLDLELFTNQLRLNDLIERAKWSLETGLDFKYQYNYSTPETMARRLVPNYEQYGGGAYAIGKYKIFPKITGEAGARYDYTKYQVNKWYDLSDWERQYAERFPAFYRRTEGNRVFTQPELTFNHVSFNAGIDYQPVPELDIKLNYAHVGRTPNVAELFADGLHHSAAVIERGDLSLKKEDGHQLNLNIDAKINVLEGARLSFNPYVFRTHNFITEVPVDIQNTIRGVFPVWAYQQVEAKMYGLDADLSLEITPQLKYQGAFSYLYGQDLSNNQPLILMLPTNFNNSLEFKNEQLNNLFIKVQQQTVLAQDRFPVYNPTVTVFENGEQAEKTLDLSTPPPAYTLWSVQAGADIAKNFSVMLNVHNVFNTKYKDYLNRLRYFSYDTGRNVILTLHYKF